MIIKIEPGYFRNGTICSSIFPTMKSSKPLTNITKTSTLQYDKCTKKYILLVPRNKKQKISTKKKISAGIDLGVRSFATVYSKNNTYSICNKKSQKKNLKPTHKKIDKINELLQMEDKELVLTRTKVGNEFIEDIIDKDTTRQKLKRALRKYHRKIKNKIKDMHYKAAYELVNTFDNIYIGKLSTKKILSRNNKTINSNTKRMLQTLSPYQFRQIMKYMGYKYGTLVTEVSEYQTTITCSNCGRINYIGSSKIYKCQKCKMIASRDENSAKTHLKLGIMERNKNREKEKKFKQKKFKKELKEDNKADKKLKQKAAGSKTNKKKPKAENKKKKIVIIEV